MVIRREEPADYKAVYQLVKAAFERAEHSDGNEQDLVNDLRKSEAFIPELSLVAELEGKIVGHILFTKLQIGAHTALALAPLAVLPGYRRQGVGTALIQEGHRRSKELGYSYSVVLGSEHYYPRAGYVPAEQFGILPCFDVPSQNFMAYRLGADAPAVSGVVRYAKEFGME